MTRACVTDRASKEWLQVGPGRGTAKDTKAEDHDGNGIEQQNEVFFLLKTALLLACCS